MFTSYYNETSFSQPQNNNPLQAVLGALEKAQKTGKACLLRLFIEAPISDPWEGLDASEVEPYFAWHDPYGQLTFVAYGAVRTLKGSGSGRFQQIADDYSQCLEQVHSIAIGGEKRVPEGLPVAMGGFSFFSDGDQNKQWPDWPEALWFLPRVTILTSSKAGKAVSGAILQQIVYPNSSPQALAAEIVQSVSNISQPREDHLPDDENAPLQAENGSEHCQDFWKELVNSALDRIASAGLDKVVVARGEDIGGGPVDAKRTLHRLRALHPTSRCFAFSPGNGTVFLGASPELLAEAGNGTVATHALAGTASRGLQDTAHELIGSKKDRYEQNVVVRAIEDALKPHCESLTVDAEPTVAGFGEIEHLCSHLKGSLLTGPGLLDVAQALHPTPAVCGYPRVSAIDWLSENERLDRGWYAGPIGWLDAEHGGTLAVAIRSALVTPTHTRCFAGAGLVPGSNAEGEWRETCLKLSTVRSGLTGRDS